MTFEQFLRSIPHSFKPEERAFLEQAFAFGEEAHRGQKRKSGEDYFSHPIEAALLLGQIFPDATSITAVLLHDVPEDTTKTLEDIRTAFGGEVAHLVDGVTKLGGIRLRNSTEPLYVESLRKMFIATGKDIRVMLVKLADRLHNMRTIQYLSPEKQLKIATETLAVYAPIAARLGINQWKDELEDRSFAICNPEAYHATQESLQHALNGKEHRPIEKRLLSVLKKEGVKFADLYGRTKRLYSFHKKLSKYQGDAGHILDLIAFRVITRSTADCYAALGAIHKHFPPLPNRIKDYIGRPKPNGYQSLHTTVVDADGTIFEVQLRTDLMHEAAERGVAAHWFYKDSGKSSVSGAKNAWVQELQRWQEETANSEDFMESLQVDYFEDRIFVFTPKGDVKDLPQGATIIDFAFAIHSDLGYYMTGAKVNGKMVKLTTQLEQGDTVEILKSKQPVKLSRDWLAAAHTTNARNRIRAHLKERDKGVADRVRELADLGLPNLFKKK